MSAQGLDAHTWPVHTTPRTYSGTEGNLHHLVMGLLSHAERRICRNVELHAHRPDNFRDGSADAGRAPAACELAQALLALLLLRAVRIQHLYDGRMHSLQLPP